MGGGGGGGGMGLGGGLVLSGGGWGGGGLPAEGVGRDLGSAAGESFPHQYLSGTLMLAHFLIGNVLDDLHIHSCNR